MAYYRDLAGGFGNELIGPEEYLDVFGEFDFICIDEECTFFCPECRNMLQCETYREVKEAWETLYM